MPIRRLRGPFSAKRNLETGEETDWSQISRSDQRSYIKIENLRGKTPTEINNALHEVCGDSVVIATERVPPGSTVTAAYYRKFLQDVLRPKIRQKKVRHVRSRPHVSRAVSEILEKYGWQVLPHPPYSPDMSPPNFDLFPKLKKPLRGKCFRSIVEVSNEMTRVIRRINNEGVLTGIQDLPKSCTAVIKHNENYIEGLKMYFVK